MGMPADRDLESQIRQLEGQLQTLKEEVERRKGHGEELLEALNAPRSFAELIDVTGELDRELIHQLHALQKAGKVERWDLPRWVRADIPARDKLRIAFSETPLQQHEIEELSGLRRGQVSGQVTELQREGLIKLGAAKGDPWFLPPVTGERGLARGTQYQLHRSHRDPKDEAPTTPRSRGRRDGT